MLLGDEQQRIRTFRREKNQQQLVEDKKLLDTDTEKLGVHISRQSGLTRTAKEEYERGKHSKT